MGADIVIAVDLQHDAHLMQQDLFSLETPRPEAEEKEGPWHTRLRARLTQMSSRRTAVTPTAMEIMTTSIQVLENRLKRNRMAGDPPDILLSHTVRKCRRSTSIAQERRLPRANWPWKRKWMNYYP